ncbi:MAG: hypothetical protein PHP93_02730 [Kiritimatiellales bacterium]|nr:hypothetical protein [Kiritimatiellales bacterium]
MKQIKLSLMTLSIMALMGCTTLDSTHKSENDSVRPVITIETNRLHSVCQKIIEELNPNIKMDTLELESISYNSNSTTPLTVRYKLPCSSEKDANQEISIMMKENGSEAFASLLNIKKTISIGSDGKKTSKVQFSSHGLTNKFPSD